MARSTGSKTIPEYGKPALGFTDQGRLPKSYRHARSDFYEAGVDSFSQPPGQDPESFTQLTNVLPSQDGVLRPRWGLAQVASDSSGYFSLYQTTSGTKYVVQVDPKAGKISYLSSGSQVQILPSGGSIYSRMASSNGVGYISYMNLKWRGPGTSTENWGFAAPSTAVTLGTAGAGSITLVTGRVYYCVYRNSTTGHTSDLNPVSASTGALTDQNQPLTLPAASGDSQVDQKVILATADGGDQTVLYQVAIVSNATTSYTDDTPEDTLLTNQVWLSTDPDGTEHGVADNGRPPSLSKFPTKHRGRMYVAQGSTLYFSKSVDELTTSTGFITGVFEESFPATYFFEIADTVETITGLLSYGDTLFIGTEHTIRRLQGDGPQTFIAPEGVFADVGVANQATWQSVFLEGSPIGAMWLTPDARVIISDFNTYRDVGTAIQDQLNTATNLANARAAYVSHCAYSFYVLAVSTGTNTFTDTLFVYNLRTQKWVVWRLNPPTGTTPHVIDVISFMPGVGQTGEAPTTLFSIGPQEIADPTTVSGGILYQMSPSYTSDATNALNPQIVTAWLDLGDPTLIKALNELEVFTTAPGLLYITVQGANSQLDFATPFTIVSEALPSLAPTSDMFKLYLAGYATKYKFYRFKFGRFSGGTTSYDLAGYIVHVAPQSRL